MEDLISKKDLLEKTKISYGQLYRWKRKDIIPEDWFIKKSTFTGQETFLPKEKVLERINLILSMKDDKSLDEMCDFFNKKIEVKEYKIDELIEKNILSDYTKNVFYSLCGNNETIGIKELLIIGIIEKYLVKSIITMDEMRLIIDIISNNFDNLFKEEARIYVFRKFGVPFVMGCIDYNQVMIDKELVKIIDIHITKELTEINKLVEK
ncbi:DUF4004 family protein [Paraclostridium bifermentans]|uniref:DUF4004 family protein n=1 Tax=Paraclostridium bifermentans TaxID=1490 RepID=UPI00359C8FF4